MPTIANVRYVAPYGSDSASGSSWDTAMLSISAALTQLQAAGGGELHITDGVTGNFWFRGDGVSAPGWFSDFPLKVVGHGRSHIQFGFPAASITTGAGGGGGRFAPSIWLAKTFQAKEFHNLVPASNFCNQLVRMWDYRRDQSTGAVIQPAITSWTRNGDGTSTLVLTLPPPISIATASRTGSLVTLRLSLPGSCMCNTKPGQVVRISSTDPDFASGDFLTAGGTDGYSGVIVYDQGTGTGTASGGAIGTFQSHDCGVYDRIDVVSTVTDVPSTMFRVCGRGNDAQTIVVTDPYGGKPYAISDSFVGNYATSGTWTSPGSWAYQDRWCYQSSLVDFHNVQGYVSAAQNYDRPEAGPSWDLGASADGRIRLYNCVPAGYAPVHGVPDLDRRGWMLADAGKRGSTAFECYDTRPISGGVRQYGSKDGSWGIRMVSVLGDTSIGTSVVAYEALESNIYGNLYLENVRTWDNAGGNDVVVDGAIGQSMTVNCGVVSCASLAMGNVGSGGASAWALGQPGFWGGKVAGDLPHARRSSPIATSRFGNLIYPPTSWTILSGTLTTKVADPLGGTGAVRMTGAGSGYWFYPQDTPTSPVVGDTWVYGGWFRRSGGWAGFGPAFVMNFNIINNLGLVQAGAQLFPPFQGDGEWQFMWQSTRVASLSGTSFTLRFSGNADAVGVEYYGLFFFKVPSGALSGNELAEYLATLRQHAQYLQAGQAGTMEGVPFVAHGGLGVDRSKILQVGSGHGQILLGTGTQVMPVYASDGQTVIGYVPLFTGVVQP